MRRLLVVLASHTGWGLNEMLDLTVTDLLAYAEATQDELNKAE